MQEDSGRALSSSSHQSAHQIPETSRGPHKDSSLDVDSCQSTIKSLSLRRSVDSLPSDETSSVSLSSHERSCGSTPPKLSSITSFSESSTSLPLPHIHFTVATLIEGSLHSRTWGMRRLDFDWTLSEKELCQAEEMTAKLREIITIKWTSKSITGIVF